MAERRGSELRELIAYAKELGFTCEQTNSNHLVFRRPGTMPVWASLSPSCRCARLNTRRDLKHAVAHAGEGRGHA